MRPHFRSLVPILLLLPACFWAQTAASKPVADPLNRTNPRSAVTAFLESCHARSYARAAQYLDVRQLPAKERTAQGPRLARQLESILNSDSRFNVLQLSQSPDGNLSDDANPALEQIAAISRNGSTFSIELERVALQPGLEVWLFSPATVSAIPALTPTSTESAIEARLPRFLVSIQILETPIWKWIALVGAAAIILFLFRSAGYWLISLIQRFTAHLGSTSRWVWVTSRPSALARFCLRHGLRSS